MKKLLKYSTLSLLIIAATILTIPVSCSDEAMREYNKQSYIQNVASLPDKTGVEHTWYSQAYILTPTYETMEEAAYQGTMRALKEFTEKNGYDETFCDKVKE
jgi:hypothetical protein